MGVTDSRLVLKKFLRRHKIIGIDANLLIYWIEDNKRYARLLEPFFAWLDLPGNTGITSTLTMLEILVKPYQASAQELVDAFYGLLATFPNLKWQELTLPLADRAAQIRAELGLKTPDAIQIATAIDLGAKAFLGNDYSFKKVPDMEIMILEELLHK